MISANEQRHYNDDLLTITLASSEKIRPQDMQGIKKINAFFDFKEKYKNFISFTFKNNFLDRTIDISTGLEHWKDIEYFYFNCLKEIVRTSIEKKRPEIKKIRSLNSDLEQIKRLLTEYLIKNVKPVIDSLFERRLIESGFYDIFQSNIMDNENKVIIGPAKTLILNFNYTHTISKYPKNIFANSTGVRVSWIHGSISNPNNPVIFGYGDEKNDEYRDIENLNRNEFLENIKYYRYLRTSNFKDLMSFIDQGFFEVLILGHSCGLSDRTLLSRIFENKKCQKIQIYHYGGFEGYKTTTQEISRHMVDKSEFLKKVFDYDVKYECPQIN